MPNDFQTILGKVAHSMFVTKNTNIAESFRPRQIKSKKWLVYEITKFKKEFNKVAVLGSWNSILLYELMAQNGKVGFWDFYDIDSNVHIDRDGYFTANNMVKNYASFEINVNDYFDPTPYDLIINPSCEHMRDMKAIEGPMYALTSNNYTQVKDHINTIQRHEDLAIKNGINNILYEGTLRFSDYERYCTIGYAK